MLETQFSIHRDSDYCRIKEVPLDDWDIVVDFYLHRVPSAGAVHDIALENLTETQCNVLYEKLLLSGGISSEKMLELPNSLLSETIRQKIIELKLDDKGLTVDGAKGFFLNSKQAKPTLISLLDHIRNAIAHGRVCKVGNYIVLEDKSNGSKAKGQLTARLVISLQIMLCWAKVIEQFVGETQANQITH